MIQSLQKASFIKRILLASMIYLVVMPLKSQDIHFSDFTMAPLRLNPGLTGSFKGTYRASGIYRDQWRSVSNSRPFATFMGSIEFNVKGNLLLDNDWVAGGLSFLNDNAGGLGFKTSVTGLNLGYHLGLDKNYKNVASVGVSFGSTNISINRNGFLGSSLTDINVQPDYDAGEGEPIIPLGPDGETNPAKFSDISLGFTYKAELDGGSQVRFGITGAHLTGGERSITAAGGSVNDPNDPNDPNPPTPTRPTRNIDVQKFNLVLFGQASTLMGKRARLNPAFLFMTAGGQTQFQLQSTVDYLVNAKEEFSLTGGLGIRTIPFDAGYLIAGVKIKDIAVRVTYDLTLSNLTQAGGNSFELSVGYIGRIFKEPKTKPAIFCPRL